VCFVKVSPRGLFFLAGSKWPDGQMSQRLNLFILFEGLVNGHRQNLVDLFLGLICSFFMSSVGLCIVACRP
jgi:hypothetical protein